MEETKVEKPLAQQIIDTFNSEKKRYEPASSESRSEIVDIYNAYNGKMDEVQNTPYDVKESIPKLRTEIAYVKPFIFSGEPEIEVEGVGDEDRTISKILEKMVNYRISQSIPNAYEKIESWVHQGVTFGTSLIKVIWRFQTTKQIDPETGEEFETPTVDEPDLEIPNILDTYYNPMIPEVEGQSSMICRSAMTVDQVKANPAYDFLDEMGIRNADKVEGKASFSKDQYNSTNQINAQTLANQDGMVEIFERYTNDKIQTIAVGKETLVVREVDNKSIVPIGLIKERH